MLREARIAISIQTAAARRGAYGAIQLRRSDVSGFFESSRGRGRVSEGRERIPQLQTRRKREPIAWTIHFERAATSFLLLEFGKRGTTGQVEATRF